MQGAVEVWDCPRAWQLSRGFPGVQAWEVGEGSVSHTDDGAGPEGVAVAQGALPGDCPHPSLAPRIWRPRGRHGQTSEEEGEMSVGPCERGRGRGLETSRGSGTLLASRTGSKIEGERLGR